MIAKIKTYPVNKVTQKLLVLPIHMYDTLLFVVLFWNEINSVLDHDSALQGYTKHGTMWANEMNFVMNHAPGLHYFEISE